MTGSIRFILLMSVLLLGIVFFLSADQFIGAIYLRSAYSAIGVLIGFSLILILFILAVRKHVTRETLIGWSLVCLVIALCATVTSPYTSLIGWLVLIFLGASVDNSPIILAAFIVIGAVVSIICFKIAALLPARIIIFSMIIMVAFYSFTVAAKAQSLETRYASLPFNNQFYVAHVISGGYHSPDHLTLYECNQVALLCQNIYEISDWFYTYDGSNNIEFVPDFTSNNISLRIGNTSIHTPSSRTETE